MPALHKSFPQHGLTLLDYSYVGSTNLLRKPATDNCMMALEELSFVIIGRGGEAGKEISAKEYSTLLDKAVAEVQNGVTLWIDMMVVVGRKK